MANKTKEGTSAKYELPSRLAYMRKHSDVREADEVFCHACCRLLGSKDFRWMAGAGRYTMWCNGCSKDPDVRAQTRRVFEVGLGNLRAYRFELEDRLRDRESLFVAGELDDLCERVVLWNERIRQMELKIAEVDRVMETLSEPFDPSEEDE